MLRKNPDPNPASLRRCLYALEQQGIVTLSMKRTPNLTSMYSWSLTDKGKEILRKHRKLNIIRKTDSLLFYQSLLDVVNKEKKEKDK